MQPQFNHTPGLGASGYRVMALPWVVSGVAHLLLIAVLAWMPQFAAQRGRSISAIHVTMVTLADARPGAPGPPSAPAKAPEPEKVPAAEPAPVPPPPKPAVAPKEAVSIAVPKPKPKVAAPEAAPPRPAPAVKKSLKHQTYRSDRAVSEAIADLKENVESARPAVVDAAIDRLKATTGPSAAIEKLKAEAAEGQGGGGGGGGAGGSVLGIEDIYRLEVAYTVNKNWAFSESLTGGRSDLYAEVAFTVLPDGQIGDVWFDRRSGNSYLDESAKRAILKSNPLAPHPKGVRRPYITVGLRFTPKGVLQ